MDRDLKGMEGLRGQLPGRWRGSRDGVWLGMEVSLGVLGSRVGDCAGFGRRRERMGEGRRLVTVIQLFCPFSGYDCPELESSMAESSLRARDLGR